MNKEIKEILDTLQECVDNPINEFYYPEKVDNRVHMNSVACKVLLDYITNLQQENERLKTKTKEQSLLLIDYQDMEQKLDDYKSRIEKAIEYIQNHQLVFQLSTMEQIVSWFDEFYKDTINILRGNKDGRSDE